MYFRKDLWRAWHCGTVGYVTSCHTGMLYGCFTSSPAPYEWPGRRSGTWTKNLVTQYLLCVRQHSGEKLHTSELKFPSYLTISSGSRWTNECSHCQIEGRVRPGRGSGDGEVMLFLIQSQKVFLLPWHLSRGLKEVSTPEGQRITGRTCQAEGMANEKAMLWMNASFHTDIKRWDPWEVIGPLGLHPHEGGERAPDKRINLVPNLSLPKALPSLMG